MIRDHILPIAHGDGSNGKSTILGAMLDVWGSDYAMKANSDLLLMKKGECHPTEKADLFGKRLVVAIETDQGRRLNESQIKELTGGDPIRARRMREDFWEFRPTHKIVMAVNHDPRVRGTDHGMWRRVCKIPFTFCMPDGRADRDMTEKLRGEAGGILAWFVEGCLDWQRNGIGRPAEVLEATGTFRSSQDTIGGFLGECTTPNRAGRVRAGDLYEKYKQWAVEANERVESKKMFGSDLSKRGFETSHSDGTWYQGLEIQALGTDLGRLQDWHAGSIADGKLSVAGTIDAAATAGLLRRLENGKVATDPIFQAGRALGYRPEESGDGKVWGKRKVKRK